MKYERVAAEGRSQPKRERLQGQSVHAERESLVHEVFYFAGWPKGIADIYHLDHVQMNQKVAPPT